MTEKSASTIGILNYSAGNTGSVKRALERLQIACTVIDKPEQLDQVEGLIFPGAGSAKAAIEDLMNKKLVQTLRDYKKPFLGLCLGMQLLFERSAEGPTECLGIIPGEVISLPDDVVKPHMGWNQITSTNDWAYFVHSYVCVPSDPNLITLFTRYGEQDLCVGVQYRNYFGLQWHPEKSGLLGDRYLLAFAKLCS